jgi:hypothetical protein
VLGRTTVVPAEELVGLLEERDELRVVVRAQQGVESLLNLLLLDALPHAEGKEIERLRFSLKTELLVAMGVIQKSDHPPFEKLDQLRNRFAHKPDAALTDKDATELKGCMSSEQSSMYGVGEFTEAHPGAVVGAVALVLHSQLWKTAERKRDSAIDVEYGMKELRATLDRSKRGERHPARSLSREDEVRMLIDTERTRRNAAGEP